MEQEKEIAALAATEEEVKEDVVTEDVTTEEGEGDEVVDAKSPYQEELERIEAEKNAALKALEEKDAETARIMALKDKAIEKAKVEAKSVKETWKSEALLEMERRLDMREARSQVKELSSDETAQKVILHYFETLPAELRKGDVQDQLLTAMALANRKRVASLLNQDQANDEANRRSIASMGSDGGSASSVNPFNLPPSAAARAASKLASIYAGKDKDLAKRLAKRAEDRLKK